MSRRLALCFLSVICAAAIDNGVGVTPPMGWSSWTAAWMDPNQTYMEQVVDALTMKRRFSNAAALSLSSLGYTRANLDDGWPACGTGINGTFHDAAGHPLVNLTRFPDLRKMNAYGVSKGIQVGWYLNNCDCPERDIKSSKRIDAQYKGDTDALVSYGFAATKFDACGQFGDLERWADLINASGQQVLIENCHWGGDGPYIKDNSTGDLWCPYNLYRTGADVVPNSWASFMDVLDKQTSWLHHDPPLSRPGCWAYFDSVQTGQYSRIEEDRTHFGAACITSSPLILGLDVTDSGRLERVWSILSNREAIAVNQAWAGHPGRLVNQTHRQLPIRFAHALPCDGSDKQKGWHLGLISNTTSGTRAIKFGSTGECVDAWSHVLTLEPCTNNASQQFVYDDQVGTIRAPNYPNNAGDLNGCLDMGGKIGPEIQLTKCYNQPNDFFSFGPDGVWSGGSGVQPYPKRCVQIEHGYQVESQLFAKPQPGGAVAVFAFSAGLAAEVTVNVDLEKLFQLFELPSSSKSTYSVHDIWNQKALPSVTGSIEIAGIANHDSRFYLLAKESERIV